MRVLFSVSSWPTHYAAMVPLGWALQAGGHEVRVLCAPSQTEPVSRAGLLPVPVLDGMPVPVHNRLSYLREVVRGDWPYPWLPPHPLTGARQEQVDDLTLATVEREVTDRYAARTGRGHDDAVTFAQSWRPHVVVHDPVSTEGALVAAVLGIPAALTLWGPVGTHEGHPLDILGVDLGNSFQRHGCAPYGADGIEYVIDPCPAAVAPPVRGARLPVRFIPYNGAGVPPEPWQRPAGKPCVVVTWSTALSTMSGPDSYALPAIVAALGELDVDLVLTATPTDIAALPELPATVRVLTGCPLRPLLTGTDLVVHHGGAGSTMTALSAGVPQLAITFAREQERIGERLAGAGVGRHLPGYAAPVAAIRAAANAILDRPEYQEAAQRLSADAQRLPTPLDLVAGLNQLARR